MEAQHVKQRIREMAAEAGVHGIGFSDAAPLREARHHFDQAIAAGYIPAGSIPGAGTLDRLVDPMSRMKTARSVVTAYLSYHTGEPHPEDPLLGVIAPYTRADFYSAIRARLATVASAMGEEFGAASKVSSNYVTLAEKPLAARSGLGFYGKNGIIISPRHGSFIVLGEIVTDLEVEPDRPVEPACGDCSACMKACPTGAIERPGWVNRGICIQYIGERRGTVPHSIRELWSNRLYGCSTCQDVCPFNRDIPAAAPQAPPGRVGTAIPLAVAVGMDDREFRHRFEANQIGMRELNAIRRNAILAAGCSGAAGLAGCIEACLHDPDPMIRGHAAWSLARLRGPGARPALQTALLREWDPAVRSEIERALDGGSDFA
jgi:epoxyqueuosine reductase